MKLADIPEDAWEIIDAPRVEEIARGALHLYGEPLRLYGARHEGATAVVIVWMGPTFMTFVRPSPTALVEQFDDEWPAIAEWHTDIVAKLVFPLLDSQ